MGDFDILKSAAAASDSIDKARSFIIGGPLTEALEAVGDAVMASALEHLRQAHQSPLLRDRLLQAAAGMQDAFFLYSDSASRGPSKWLRAIADTSGVAGTHEKAACCAATVALIHWFLGESPQNIRESLDRTNECLREYDDIMIAALRLRTFSNPSAVHVYIHDFDEGVRRPYFKMEENILPPELIAPRPAWFQPRTGLTGAEILDYAQLEGENPLRW